MSDILTLNRPCQAQDPTSCPHHGEQARLQQLMDISAETNDLDAYFTARKEYENVVGRILLDEEADFGTYEELFAEQLEENRIQTQNISQQLMRMNQTGDYSGMNWKLFAKWAVQYRSPQSYGSLLEQRYIRENGYQRVPSRDERGDFLNLKTKEYSEFKVTAADDENNRKVNFVQIRPHHKLHSYHLVVVDKTTGDTELFVLTKKQMQSELTKVGGLAHGTNASNNNEQKEYAIRFSALDTDVTFSRWKKSYEKPFLID